ncbi:MAG: MBL fold metallo-hydrolase, partial [Vicinamibacterales bacterium]
MKRYVVGASLAMGLTSVIISAQAPATVDGLVSAAKVAAGTDWPGTFARLCIPPPPASGRGGSPAAQADTAPRREPPRESWHAEPAKVGDNFYFLGTKVHHSWALVGSEGIIVLEALFEYAVADEVAGGLKQLGLDIRKVKFAVMSHAHADHDGGAGYLQDTVLGMRLVYGAEDWAAVESRPGRKPKRDMVGTDGQTLSVGDASIKIVTMPGHTPGTLSYLFEFKDSGKPIRVAYVGGTAIPFDQSAAWYDGYIASSKKMAKAAADFGATALISNHSEFDNGYFKAQTAAGRKRPGEANPFEVGRESVARYFTTVSSCAEA